MKKYCVILVLVLLCIVLFPTFALDSQVVTIDGVPVTFQAKIEVRQDGEVFVPMKEFFTYMGIQYVIHEDGEVTAFRDNIFLKFHLHSSVYTLNGREFQWPQPPYEKDSVMFLPSSGFLPYMKINTVVSEKADVIAFQSEQAAPKLLTKTDNSKTIYLPGNQVSVNIPIHWKTLDQDRYGFGSPTDYFELTAKRFQTAEPISLPNYITSRRSQELDPLHPQAKVSEENLLVAGISISRIDYQWQVESEKKNLPKEEYLDSYLFFTFNKDFYEFSFRSNIRDSDFNNKMINDVIQTLRLISYSIDVGDEHYVEYDSFKLYNFFLASPLYSNMDVTRFFLLKGTCNPSIKKLEVHMEKDKKICEYTVNVKDGRFSQMIPMPFGLGVYQMSLVLPDKEFSYEPSFSLTQDSGIVLRSSIVNKSIDKLLYTTSSKYVNVENLLLDEYISTNPSLTRDQKAYQALEGLRKDFAIDEEREESVNDMNMALLLQSANEYSITHIYVALLRKMEIPARIMTLKDEALTRYYVEFEMNGVWYRCDPYEALLQKRVHLTHFFKMEKNFQEKNYTQTNH